MRGLTLIIALSASCDRCRDPTPAPTPVVRTQPRNWAPPSRSPRPELASAWSAAEMKKSAAAWDAAADAYARERASCVDDCSDDAYAVVIARKNALGADPLTPPTEDELPPLPPRIKALVAALDDYVKIAPPNDPDVLDMRFLAANVLNTWHQEDAIARLQALLRDYRTDPHAEYVVNMLLDALLRFNLIAEAKLLVDTLLADAAFLAGKDQLRATLEMLRTRLR